MLFIKLTSPTSAKIHRIYINAERIEEMVWNASMQRTYISMSGGDDELREVQETPEEILQQIDHPFYSDEEEMGIDDALRLLDQLMYGDPSGQTHIENVPKLKEYVFNLRHDLAIAKRDLKRATDPAPLPKQGV